MSTWLPAGKLSGYLASAGEDGLGGGAAVRAGWGP